MQTCVSIGELVSGSEIATAPTKLSGYVAYSTIDESVPIAYLSQQPQCMFPGQNVVHPGNNVMTPFDA